METFRADFEKFQETCEIKNLNYRKISSITLTVSFSTKESLEGPPESFLPGWKHVQISMRKNGYKASVHPALSIDHRLKRRKGHFFGPFSTLFLCNTSFNRDLPAGVPWGNFWACLSSQSCMIRLIFAMSWVPWLLDYAIAGICDYHNDFEVLFDCLRTLWQF